MYYANEVHVTDRASGMPGKQSINKLRMFVIMLNQTTLPRSCYVTQMLEVQASNIWQYVEGMDWEVPWLPETQSYLVGLSFI